MLRIFLPILFSLIFIACGKDVPEPQTSTGPGSVSGVIRVMKPERALIYLAIGRSYDELSLGRPVKVGVMMEPGPFRFRGIKPGEYYLGAFVDINGNRIPDLPLEPYYLQESAMTVSGGEKLENIVVEGFFNERDPSFKTPERTQEYEELLAAAAEAVKDAYQELEAEGGKLLLGAVPTLRAMVFEAETTWLTAGNEADWEHIEVLLEPVPGLASGAMNGDDLLAAQRGYFLRAYVSEMNDSIQRYAVHVPREYDGSRAFPLVIALHGAGGDHWAGMKMVMGSSALVIGAKRANEQFFPRNPPTDFIVACPGGHGYMGPGYRKEGEYDVTKVIKEMVSAYNVDTDRIYLTGSSKGGSGTWEIGLKYPEMFAAIAPVCGGTEAALRLARNATRVRIYAFHGVEDRFVSVNELRVMSAAIYATGLPVEYEYKEYEELGHEAGMFIYRDGMIFRLFRKS